MAKGTAILEVEVPDKNTNRCMQAGMLSGGKWDRMHDISKRYYSTQGLSPTIHTCGG